MREHQKIKGLKKSLPSFRMTKTKGLKIFGTLWKQKKDETPIAISRDAPSVRSGKPKTERNGDLGSSMAPWCQHDTMIPWYHDSIVPSYQICTMIPRMTRLWGRWLRIPGKGQHWSPPHGIRAAPSGKYNKKLIGIPSKICQTILDRRPIAVS